MSSDRFLMDCDEEFLRRKDTEPFSFFFFLIWAFNDDGARKIDIVNEILLVNDLFVLSLRSIDEERQWRK